MKQSRDSIAIIDFGSQYTQLIARRVRELQVYSEVFSPNVGRDEITRLDPRGVILSGGPASVYDMGAPRLSSFILDLGLPVLGICYGMHLIAQELGGKVKSGTSREFGPAEIKVLEPNPLFTQLPNHLNVWMSHGDSVLELPRGFILLAESDLCAYAAIADPARKIFGLQFHPEVAHTPDGKTILGHFLFDICNARANWTPRTFVEMTIEDIRRRVGDARVLCALSGGVDSMVTATLIGRAIGERLTCVFIDHGLLRANEAAQVAELVQSLGMELVAVDAHESFLQKLDGIADPEQKRRIIGAEFIRVFDETANKLGEHKFLAQGTLYPDVIESAIPPRESSRENEIGLSSDKVRDDSRPPPLTMGGEGGIAHKIKSHHNVGGLPTTLPFKLVEPLRMLFKDEVRAVGRELGLPERVVQRQPFPGPGLAVRIIGEITEERLKILRAADAIVREVIENAKLDFTVWQYFCVLTPIRTVGVMGDARTYENVLAIRAVTSEDGMTADWARLPHELLTHMSARIVNRVRGINRVVYDITSKPPGTIEWE